jgi:hypothetical protein
MLTPNYIFIEVLQIPVQKIITVIYRAPEINLLATNENPLPRID